MKKVIERETKSVFKAEAIEGGYQIYTLDGEKYKKLRESTFKRYFKEVEEIEEPKEEISKEKRDKMIEKIKKMMSLAENNPSEEEAISAALQAHRLMAKYNIHEDDLLEGIEDSIESVITAQKHNSCLHSWRKQLSVIVAGAFRCKAYMYGKDVVFRGYKTDADLALDVYMMLYEIGDKLGSKEYRKQIEDKGTGKGAYNSFVYGFLKGVKDAFDQQCTALMLVTPESVEKDWEKFSSDFKTSKAKCVRVNKDQYERGYNEGKSVVKSRAIEGGINNEE